MPKLWAVFDIDGTLSNCDHRRALAVERRWDEFHSLCGEDSPYPAEISIAQAWVHAGGKVAFITGRTLPYRALTLVWFRMHCVPNGPLLMRPPEDERPSHVVKKELMLFLEDVYLEKGDQIAFVMEDQDDIVQMWRKSGYTCLQPRPGRF